LTWEIGNDSRTWCVRPIFQLWSGFKNLKITVLWVKLLIAEKNTMTRDSLGKQIKELHTGWVMVAKSAMMGG